MPVVERPGDPDRFSSLVSPEKNLIPRLGILGVELDDDLRQALQGLRGEAGVLVAARAGSALVLQVERATKLLYVGIEAE